MKRGVSQSQIAFALVLLLIAGPVWGQDSKPYSREAAEKSFRALVAAKDSDMMDVVKNDGYVCFADVSPLYKEDRFLTIVLQKPTDWSPERSTDDKDYHSLYDESKDSPAISFGILDFYEWENQDYDVVMGSGVSGNWHSYGHYQRLKDGKVVWRPFNDLPAIFRYKTDKDEISGATDIAARQDGSTFYAAKKYANRNNGTTTYEMNMRLSTGRYKETWTPDKGDAFESVGNCYKAKEFIRTTAPVKKTKQ